MATRERLPTEVYHDILRSIHLLRKAGKKASLYEIGHDAKVPNARLRQRLSRLVSMGLVDSNWIVTAKGYEYCEEFKRHVAPFLRKLRPEGDRLMPEDLRIAEARK